LYLRPRFCNKPLNDVKRDHIKAMVEEQIGVGLSRNTIRNTLCVIREIFNHAIEDGILESNPAVRQGRFIRSAKNAETKGISLTATEASQFLEASKEVCEDHYPLFLTALGAGLCRGELRCPPVGRRPIWEERRRYKPINRSSTQLRPSRAYDHEEQKEPPRRSVRELRRVLAELRDKRLLKEVLRARRTFRRT
jgi:hypothetical protein